MGEETNTIAEREAELLALQAAFDEYISSSRELEEELDAELLTMQEKLAESTAANAALSAQLQNLSPQISNLETSLSASRQKLKEEQGLRRQAEQKQDEADQRVRELEQSIQTVREECDAVHEELAFKENELEETRLELEVEKQQLENEANELKEQLAMALEKAQKQTASLADSLTADDATTVTTSANKVIEVADDGYVKKLEEELELVTEQLIETENRLTQTETDLADRDRQLLSIQENESTIESESLQLLANERDDLVEKETALRKELAVVTEELSLSREEVQLLQEELQSGEHNLNLLRETLEKERQEYKDENAKLADELEEFRINAKAAQGELAILTASIHETDTKNDELNEQIAGLECALANAKNDYDKLLNELNDVNTRFDESRAEAEKAGREAAIEELKASMKTDADHEIEGVRESLKKLSAENHSLQEKVDATELELAQLRDIGAADSSQNEVALQLQAQLDRSKAIIVEKDKEMAVLTSNLQRRVEDAEARVGGLENELHAAKGKLAEAEAHIIVLRREKAEAESIKNGVLDTVAPTTKPETSGRESPSDLRQQLQDETKKYKELEQEYTELQDQKRMGDIRVKRLEDELKTLQKQVFGGEAGVVTQMSRITSLGQKKEAGLLIEQVQDENIDAIISSRDVKAMGDELKTLQQKFDSQREYNAQLLSKMLHFQGNIQVYCRIRPISSTEIESGAKTVVEALSETEVGCFDSRTKKWKSFAFDRVWGPDQTQTSVFQDVEPLALSVVDGFNACIFCYGQTGSGKTYTMEGLEEGNQYGISYRTIQKVFYLLQLRAQQQKVADIFVGEDDEHKEEVVFKFSLKLGMLEIYNDEVYDLLATSGATMEEKKETSMKAGGKASLEIRRSPDGRVEVPNLTKEDVTSIEEVMTLLKRGNSNRATASTNLNEHSSRSHLVLSVDVVSGIGETDTNRGTLYLVDLAGSERVRKSNVEGENLKEAGFINKSLSALGNVMEALDRKSSHVPFRDSKLTYLLQNALGGNSRTMMIVATCPIDSALDESVHALQFATRVRRIQIGSAQRNINSKNLEETVKTLTEELRALARAKERTEGQLHSLKRDNVRVQEKLSNLSKTRSQGRNDSKTLEVLRKNNDEMAARWQKEKSAKEETTEELEKTRKELRVTQQQLGRFKSKLTQLEQKLEDKERALERASENLIQERNRKSASSVRSRRNEVLGSRVRPNNTSIQTPSPTSRPKDISTTATSPTTQNGGNEEDNGEIRTKVLELLQKYDTAKVDRVDIIMEKFKGKESLLLDKMRQRYEVSSAASTSNSSIQSRNELALQRHQERMKKIREAKANKK